MHSSDVAQRLQEIVDAEQAIPLPDSVKCERITPTDDDVVASPTTPQHNTPADQAGIAEAAEAMGRSPGDTSDPPLETTGLVPASLESRQASPRPVQGPEPESAQVKDIITGEALLPPHQHTEHQQDRIHATDPPELPMDGISKYEKYEPMPEAVVASSPLPYHWHPPSRPQGSLTLVPRADSGKLSDKTSSQAPPPPPPLPGAGEANGENVKKTPRSKECLQSVVDWLCSCCCSR